MSHSICEGFGSRVIHGGNTKDRGYRSLSMPVYQTSTFYFDSCEDGGKAFAGESDSYIYTRLVDDCRRGEAYCGRWHALRLHLFSAESRYDPLWSGSHLCGLI